MVFSLLSFLVRFFRFPDGFTFFLFIGFFDMRFVMVRALSLGPLPSAESSLAVPLTNLSFVYNMLSDTLLYYTPTPLLILSLLLRTPPPPPVNKYSSHPINKSLTSTMPSKGRRNHSIVRVLVLAP